MHTTRTIAAVLSLLVSHSMAGDWPAFRGPRGDGQAPSDSNLPVEWSPDVNVKWKAPLPDGGSSSPIVVAGRVFVTCAEDEGRKRHLYCFDRSTGEQL